MVSPTTWPAAVGRRIRHHWLRFTVPGLWVALLFAALAFTPSLLPRSPAIQGLITGLSATFGYAVGVIGAWIWRSYADRPVRAERSWSRRAFTITAIVVLVVAAIIGNRWQNQIRDLMEVDRPSWYDFLLLPLVAWFIFELLVAIGRGLRGLYRWLTKLLDRWVGAGAARVTGWVATALLLIFLVNGVLFDALRTVADNTFALNDLITPEGIEQPESPLRSGSPDSLVTWDDLGREGRKFTATGPTATQISTFTEAPAEEPIRSYAGIAAEDDIEDRAALAVADLERAGGFERANLMVATSTGSGWMVPSSMDSFEYISGGDSAIVGMQYSHFPSWISFLVDQEVARDAGRALFDAVYEKWLTLPEDARPKLYAFGESLGSFGGETAFSGEHDLANRTAGSVFTGPPHFNTLYSDFRDQRDPGSPEIEPIYRDGRIVRVTTDPEEGFPPDGQPWDGSRTVYIAHPSDPIVYWGPYLLFNKPGWLSEKRGEDVSNEMEWIPFVTFWQVTLDLPLATAVPPGHGHSYDGQHVDAWAAVMRPDGWTDEKADQLREIVLAEDAD